MGSINGKTGTTPNSLNTVPSTGGAAESRSKPVLTRALSQSSVLSRDEVFVDAPEASEADVARARPGTPPKPSPLSGPTPPAGQHAKGVRSPPANISTGHSSSSSIRHLDPQPMSAESSEAGADDNKPLLQGAVPKSTSDSVPSSPAPSYGHIDDAPPAAGSTQTSKPGPVEQSAAPAAVKKTNAALKTAGVLSVEVLEGLLSLLKGTYKIATHPLTQKLVLLGALIGCTATFGCLAVVTGGLFGAGLFLLLVPTVAVAGVIFKQDVMPAWKNLLRKSQGAA